MVKALVNIREETNQALNVVKARHGLNDKGQAIEFVVQRYLEEPELRQEFIAKMKKIELQKSIPVKNFAKKYGL